MKKVVLAMEVKKNFKSLSMLFGIPWVAARFMLEIKDDDYEFIIVEVASSKDSALIEKNKEILKKYCERNHIEYFLYKENEDMVIGGKLKAVKILLYLKMLEDQENLVLFGKSLGLAFKKLNPLFVDIIAEEARSITILDMDFSRQEKETLYKRTMLEKGLSIVFTKDTSALIKNTDVIVSENDCIAKDNLSKKVILNENWEDIILFPINEDYYNHVITSYDYKDQIAEAFLFFNSDIDIREIALCFDVLCKNI